MANAYSFPMEIEVKTLQSVKAVKLELLPEEATCLLDVMNNVAGCPTFSRRAYTDRIGAALIAAGVTPTNGGTRPGDMGSGSFTMFTAGTRKL